jgi:hypothetical protein
VVGLDVVRYQCDGRVAGRSSVQPGAGRVRGCGADRAPVLVPDLHHSTEVSHCERLDYAVHGRAEIHHATSIVLVELAISARDALARIRAYASAEQQRLPGDIAPRRSVPAVALHPRHDVSREMTERPFPERADLRPHHQTARSAGPVSPIN